MLILNISAICNTDTTTRTTTSESHLQAGNILLLQGAIKTVKAPIVTTNVPIMTA